MFGIRRIQELEYKLGEANDALEKETQEKKSFEEQLSTVTSHVTELEDNLSKMSNKATDLERSLDEAVSLASALEGKLSESDSRNAALEKLLSEANTKAENLEQELSSANTRISDLQEELSVSHSNIQRLEQNLSEANSSISELEAKLTDTDLEQMKAQVRDTQVELEGIRNLYNRKIKDFEDSLAEKEEAFARNEEVLRRDLDNEIEESRCANEEYVGDAVKRFSESYNYYLNQIKLFMDALGQVAAETGQALFSKGLADGDLRSSIGRSMLAKLQADTDLLRSDDNGMVLIGNQKSEDAVPAPPDYSRKECWYKIPEVTRDVDTFYIYATEYIMSSLEEGAPDYAALDNPEMIAGVENEHMAHATTFEDSTNVFIPYYRQTGLRFAGEVYKRDGNIDASISGMPYDDITAALDYYFENYNEGRPFIIAGHSQGSYIGKLVLKKYFKDHPEYYDRMVAAYLIGSSTTREDLAEYPHMKFASGESDTGVIVSWHTEGQRNVDENAPNVALLPNGFCINPLNWKLDDTYAPASENLGSLVANETTGEPETRDIGADAQVVPERGVVVTNAACEEMPEEQRKIASEYFGPEGHHGEDYTLFYNNIRDNVAKRVAAYLANQ